MKWKISLIYLIVSFEVFRYTDCACTYNDINTSLNTCVKAATSSTTVKWFFPHGTLAEQAEFCQSGAQTTLSTCIKNVFSGCKLAAKSLKMFSTTGSNLVNAYTGLCSATLVAEAQACMSSVSGISTFTTAETTFKQAVTALPNSALSAEICGLATTMKYTAYTTLLSGVCTDSTHLAVWSSFYDTIMNTYLCPTCSKSATGRLDYTVLFMCILTVLLYTKASLK